MPQPIEAKPSGDKTASPETAGDTDKSIAAEPAVDAEETDGRGARIIAVSLESGAAAATVLAAFARNLTHEGRPIVIDLDARGDRLAAFQGTKKGRRHQSGVQDLVSGKASFAEVIQRDAMSRVHFINFGSGDSLSAAKLDDVLEALAQTYDFILLAAPPLAGSELTRKLIPQADFVILVGTAKTAKDKWDKARDELIAGGAKEVLAIGAAGKQNTLALDVA
jgi:Mrp family chromosome partitioning ATPase